MTVENTLGIASCSRRITECASRVFVKAGPFNLIRRVSDEAFIILNRRFSGRQACFIRQAYPTLDRRTRSVNTFNDWRKSRIKHDKFVFGVIDHPSDLTGAAYEWTK